MKVEIDSSEDPFDLYKGIDSEPNLGEVIGRVAFISTSIISFGAFIPAAFKKKRNYTLTSTIQQADQPPMLIQEEAPVAGEPPAVPICTDREKEVIRDLFTTIAEGGVNLIWEGLRLRRLGNEIDHVHPFSLLIAMPKDKMREILRSGNPLKINTFVDGVEKGIRRELGINKLNKYIPSFARQFNKDPAQIKQLIQAAAWLELVQYLFDIPAARVE